MKAFASVETFDPLRDWSAGEDPELAARRNCRSWLFAILRNCWRDYVARNASGPEMISLDAPLGEGGDCRGELLSGGDDPAVIAARRESRHELLQAIAALPEAYRHAVYLRFVQGLSVEETATLLGVAPGTVRSRTNRGSRRIRREHPGLCAVI